MSIDDDTRLARRFVTEIFEEGRIDTMDTLVASDFRSHTWGPEGLDRDGLRAAMSRMSEALSEVRFIIEDTIAQDDRVALRLTASATQTGPFMGLPPSGRRYTIGEIHIVRIADGRIAEHWHQYDQTGLLRQLQG